jgi:hypothetical protein
MLVPMTTAERSDATDLVLVDTGFTPAIGAEHVHRLVAAWLLGFASELAF